MVRPEENRNREVYPTGKLDKLIAELKKGKTLSQLTNLAIYLFIDEEVYL